MSCASLPRKYSALLADTTGTTGHAVAVTVNNLER